MLARAQRDDERVVRDLIDAVADAMPRQPPTEVPRTPGRGAARADVRGAAPGPARQAPAGRPDRPAAAGAALDPGRGRRGGAGRGRRTPRAAGARRAEPPAPLRPGELWTHDADEHGFGERARTHATIALRAAADAWPVLDRLLELRVPDQLVLDTDELVSLLDEGVGALRERGVDVLWPRSLGRDLSATATLDRAAPGASREEPLNEPLLGTEALFAFSWQVALHGDPLTDAEMDQLASSATPLMRLRGNWTVVDPSIVRKARKRLLRTVKPAEAVAAALTGVVQTGAGGRPAGAGRRRRQPAQGARAAADGGDPRAGRAAGRADRDPARLPAARADLAVRAHLARARRLPRRRHSPDEPDPLVDPPAARLRRRRRAHHAARGRPLPRAASTRCGPSTTSAPASSTSTARPAPASPVATVTLEPSAHLARPSRPASTSRSASRSTAPGVPAASRSPRPSPAPAT